LTGELGGNGGDGENPLTGIGIAEDAFGEVAVGVEMGTGRDFDFVSDKLLKTEFKRATVPIHE
jgi:hypothetical protein